jgi:hypothetical protein
MPVPDFSPGEVLTAAAMDSIGLWKVAAVSFTNETAVPMNDVFTTNFVNYRLLVRLTATASTDARLSIRYGNAGSFENSNYANFVFFVGVPGSGVFANETTATEVFINQIGGSFMPATSSIDIFNPKLAERTSYNLNAAASYQTGAGQQRVALMGSGYHNANTAYASLEIRNTAGTNITGSAVLYGYRD